uniref:ARAD1D15840p n=1 Tax=Blastobotrys adeninivorans TaxID=409370 RepID=A0A060T944_BLAAD
MYRKPWYVQAADAAHRLTVLGIIGFSLYLAGGLGMTLYANRPSVRAARQQQFEQHVSSAQNEEEQNDK